MIKATPITTKYATTHKIIKLMMILNIIVYYNNYQKK